MKVVTTYYCNICFKNWGYRDEKGNLHLYYSEYCNENHNNLKIVESIVKKNFKRTIDEKGEFKDS